MQQRHADGGLYGQPDLRADMDPRQLQVAAGHPG